MTDAVPFFDLGSHIRALRADVHATLDLTIDSGYFVGGPLVEQFETDFAEYLGADFCVGVGNGLDALRLSLESRSIGQGDEVIVPAFTFYATILAVIQTGATPVPVDVKLDTANLDPALLEEAITKRTRAIIPVHLYGRPAEMSEIARIAKLRGIDVFEDAAQSHGAVSNGGMAGALGTAGAFSFYPTKNLGALGDAGAVVTSDPAIAERIRSRRSYGQGATKYEHIDTGWNSRIDPFQAAFLSFALPHLDQWNARRRQIAKLYLESLGELSGKALGLGNIDGSVWHHFVLRSSERTALRQFLTQRGVATDIHYPYAAYALEPVQAALHPHARRQPFPIADRLAAEVTSLPIGPWMTEAQVRHVADALARIPTELLR